MCTDEEFQRALARRKGYRSLLNLRGYENFGRKKEQANLQTFSRIVQPPSPSGNEHREMFPRFSFRGRRTVRSATGNFEFQVQNPYFSTFSSMALPAPYSSGLREAMRSWTTPLNQFKMEVQDEIDRIQMDDEEGKLDQTWTEEAWSAEGIAICLTRDRWRREGVWSLSWNVCHPKTDDEWHAADFTSECASAGSIPGNVAGWGKMSELETLVLPGDVFLDVCTGHGHLGVVSNKNAKVWLASRPCQRFRYAVDDTKKGFSKMLSLKVEEEVLEAYACKIVKTEWCRRRLWNPYWKSTPGCWWLHELDTDSCPRSGTWYSQRVPLRRLTSKVSLPPLDIGREDSRFQEWAIHNWDQKHLRFGWRRFLLLQNTDEDRARLIWNALVDSKTRVSPTNTRMPAARPYGRSLSVGGSDTSSDEGKSKSEPFEEYSPRVLLLGAEASVINKDGTSSSGVNESVGRGMITEINQNGEHSTAKLEQAVAIIGHAAAEIPLPYSASFITAESSSSIGDRRSTTTTEQQNNHQPSSAYLSSNDPKSQLDNALNTFTNSLAQKEDVPLGGFGKASTALKGYEALHSAALKESKSLGKEQVVSAEVVSQADMAALGESIPCGEEIAGTESMQNSQQTLDKLNTTNNSQEEMKHLRFSFAFVPHCLGMLSWIALNAWYFGALCS